MRLFLFCVAAREVPLEDVVRDGRDVDRRRGPDRQDIPRLINARGGDDHEQRGEDKLRENKRARFPARRPAQHPQRAEERRRHHAVGEVEEHRPRAFERHRDDMPRVVQNELPCQRIKRAVLFRE